MARRSPDSESRLVFVATITDPEAPTAAELNAGVDLTPFLMEWDFPESGNTIDISDMASSYNKQAAGTFGGDSGSVTAYRDDTPADDDAWSTLPRATEGYIVERLFGGSAAAFAAAQEVSVYTVSVISRATQPRTRNTPLTFKADMAITAEPLHNIAVAA